MCRFRQVSWTLLQNADKSVVTLMNDLGLTRS